MAGRQHKMKDNICVPSPWEGKLQPMPLRHKQKGQAPESLILKTDCSTFMGIKGSGRKQCAHLIWVIFFKTMLYRHLVKNEFPFIFFKEFLQSEHSQGRHIDN